MTKSVVTRTKNEVGDHWHIGPLNVILESDEQGFYAQALEIDHYASGESEEEVQENFVLGLIATLHAHMAKYNNFTGMIVPAPEEIWNKWREMHRNPKSKPAAKWAIPGAADADMGFCSVMRAA